MRPERITEVEKSVAEYYELIRPEFARWWALDKTHGLHFALYEKGIKNFEEAVLNMNRFVGKLLGLDNRKSMNILDAGCGVGGTSIYLADKYPNIRFTGITVTPGEVELAKRFAEERGLDNVNFMLKSYLNTGFPDNHFDGVFALESSSYAENKKDFVHEMYRILKPGGHLVVVDGFFTLFPSNPFLQKIYNAYRKGRGIPKSPPLILKDFKSYLEVEGFKNIRVIDLSKKVALSQVRSFFISIPFFISYLLKKIIGLRRYEPTRDVHYLIGVSVLGALIGLSKTAGYYAVVAIKEKI
ncbi:MAG: hypothetical protein DRN05_05655 [Thermoplasmata archaeon]|nr:MAG: hypothetical protein DRN05_05655 [Thermoplasmata archaeon]